MDYQRMRLEVIPIHVMALIAFIAGLIMVANWPVVHTFGLITFGLIAMTIAFASVVFLNIFIITLERIDERRRGVTK